MIPPLSALTCFTHICDIQPITSGLSCHCYQVKSDNKTFFAKNITTIVESRLSHLAAQQSISPQVVYHDQHWLITEFIDGENLSLCHQPMDEKIAIAIKLMVQCHQLSANLNEFEPKSIANELIDRINFSALKSVFTSANHSLDKNELLAMTNKILSHIPHTSNIVCCHGDINFSNILLSANKRTYLIDYECACAAPPEYDLAMFFAVNNLTKEHIPSIIQHYNKLALVDLNLPLFNHYLQFCYFINGLWYMGAFQTSELSTFIFLAKQQWQNLHVSTSKTSIFSNLL